MSKPTKVSARDPDLYPLPVYAYHPGLQECIEDARRWLLLAAYMRSRFLLGLAIRKLCKAINACPTAVLPPELEELRRQAREVIEVFKAEGVQ